MAPAGKDALKKAADLLRAGNRKQAQPLLAELLREEPENHQAWYLLSYALEDKQKQEYAVMQALRIDPGFERARTRLASLRGLPITAAPQPAIPRPVPIPPPKIEPRPVPAFTPEPPNKPAFFDAEEPASSTEHLRAEAVAEVHEKKPAKKPSRGHRLVFAFLILTLVALAAYFGRDLVLAAFTSPDPTATQAQAFRTLPPTWTPSTVATNTATPRPPTVTPSTQPTLTETGNPLP